MNILNIATQLFLHQLGVKSIVLSHEFVSSQMRTLFPIKDGDLDIKRLTEAFLSKDIIRPKVTSWLGNGTNQSISSSAIFVIFGEENINLYAVKLGLNKLEAADALARMIPNLLDKCSVNGQLVDDLHTNLGAKLAESIYQ